MILKKYKNLPKAMCEASGGKPVSRFRRRQTVDGAGFFVTRLANAAEAQRLGERL